MSGPLNHPPCYVVRQLLEDLGVGASPAAAAPWPLFAAREPGDPDNVITVYDTAGRDLGRGMPDQGRSELYGIQVRVRGSDLPGASAKARQAALALDGVYERRVLAGGQAYTVRHFSRSGPPLSLGTDAPATARRLYTVNGLVSLRLA